MTVLFNTSVTIFYSAVVFLNYLLERTKTEILSNSSLFSFFPTALRYNEVEQKTCGIHLYFLWNTCVYFIRIHVCVLLKYMCILYWNTRTRFIRIHVYFLKHMFPLLSNKHVFIKTSSFKK